MSTPANPSQGKPDGAETELEAQEAKEAVAQEEAAEAAEAPAADAPAAEAEEAAAEDKPKRARRPRTKGTPEVKEAAKAAPRAAAETAQRPVVRAQAKYVRTSARKARLVCDLLRGKDVNEARAILAYNPRAVSRDWAKVLESAIANAEHNHELVGDDLRILTATADEGPTLKRFRPRAMGRATRIRKRTSHLTITLTPKE
jgi:ribosomal protein L22